VRLQVAVARRFVRRRLAVSRALYTKALVPLSVTDCRHIGVNNTSNLALASIAILPFRGQQKTAGNDRP
jgi:hypothetical protein